MSEQAIVTIQPKNANGYSQVALLLEGALQRCRLAHALLLEGDSGSCTRVVISAVTIIETLRISLDLEAGGELAERLDYLYGYICVRLTEGNELQDASAFGESTLLLGEIYDAWQQIPEEYRQPDAIAA